MTLSRTSPAREARPLPSFAAAPFLAAAEDITLLRSETTDVRTVGPRKDLLQEGDTPTEAFVILEGWGQRYKDLAEGNRQILGFLLPGDLCLDSRHHPVSHCVASLTTMRYGIIPLPNMERLMAASSKFAQAVWRQQLRASAIQLEWIANSGRPAHERIAHLLCEMFARAQHAGLCHSAACEFPPTQFDIACALGLTSVHVNRMLQQLRAEGLITLHGRKLVIDDVEGLNQLALFDPGYLHSAHGHP